MSAVRTPPPGRPRDPRIDDAVLAATRELLTELGYRNVSIGLVARRAGVHRPAIYRRWPSKPHLVFEAVYPMPPTPLPVATDSGDFATDFRAYIARVVNDFRRPEAAAALPGLLADLSGEPEMRRSVIDRMDTASRRHVNDMLTRAADRGQIAPGTDAGVLFDCVVGSVIQRMVVTREPSDQFAGQLADLLIAGLVAG
jgi:AcrR family transcriptional regulator